MSNVRMSIYLDEESVKVLEKHFGKNFSLGIRECIKTFNEDYLTTGELKIFLKKVVFKN